MSTAQKIAQILALAIMTTAIVIAAVSSGAATRKEEKCNREWEQPVHIPASKELRTIGMIRQDDVPFSLFASNLIP